MPISSNTVKYFRSSCGMNGYTCVILEQAKSTGFKFLNLPAGAGETMLANVDKVR